MKKSGIKIIDKLGIPYDKWLHFVVGTMTMIVVLAFLGSVEIAFLTSFFAAVGKELVWDKLLKKGTPDIVDYFATMFTPIIVMVINIIISLIN